MKETINGLAVCAGIGGLERGLSGALSGRYRTVGYVEREAYAAATLVARMESEDLDRAPIWDDLSTFDGRPWRNRVDLVTAGIPCQPFSSAGQRRGVDDPRWLWPHLWRVVRECGASSIFLENTPGIRSKALPTILADLAEGGWSAEWGLYRADWVGAPHRRQRFFLLAHTDSGGRPVVGSGGLFDGIGETLGDDPDRPSRAPVADPNGIGRDGRAGEIAEPDRGRQPAHSGSFPPGPDDWERWIEWDGSQPGIRRDADGTAHRMDRLRCLGNAVVPDQAAEAFTQLAARFQ